VANPAQVASAPIDIVIADDHAMVRAGLRLLLEADPGLRVVAEAGDVDGALEQTRTHGPAVVLLDLNMPGTRTLPAIPRFFEAAPGVAVVVLTMYEEPAFAREAMKAGASGYVLKEAADTEVVAAVRAVVAGEQYINPALGARLVSADADARKRAELDPLSDREREVLRLLALGHTNQEIAQMLYISVRTAETHRMHIMQKLHLSSRAELVRYALAEGLVGEEAS
jgi:two-component system, NarL family, response regulator NreC